MYPIEGKTNREGPLRVLEYHNHYRNEELIKYIPYCPGLDVLDCGCDRGTLVDQLYGRAKATYGVDRSLRRFEDSLVPDEVAVSRNEQLPFGDGAFDVLLGEMAIEKSADLPLMLSEFCRVLRPAGHLVLWERRQALCDNTRSELNRTMLRLGLICMAEEPFDWLAFPTAAMLDAIPLLGTSHLAQTLTKITFAIDGFLARAPALREKSWHVIIVADKRIDH